MFSTYLYGNTPNSSNRQRKTATPDPCTGGSPRGRAQASGRASGPAAGTDLRHPAARLSERPVAGAGLSRARGVCCAPLLRGRRWREDKCVARLMGMRMSPAHGIARHCTVSHVAVVEPRMRMRVNSYTTAQHHYTPL